MLHDFKTFPVLHTDRLDLIQIEHSHLSDMFKLFTDPQVSEFYHVLPLREEQDVQKVIDMFKARYAEKQGIRWGIALKNHKEIIGTIGFNSFTNAHRAVIAYALMPHHWNKGLMSEALKAVLKFGFEELRINRIEAEVMPGNISSEKILVKNGFACEGLLREWTFWEGKYYDMKMYAILADSWTV